MMSHQTQRQRHGDIPSDRRSRVVCEVGGRTVSPSQTNLRVATGRRGRSRRRGRGGRRARSGCGCSRRAGRRGSGGRRSGGGSRRLRGRGRGAGGALPANLGRGSVTLLVPAGYVVVNLAVQVLVTAGRKGVDGGSRESSGKDRKRCESEKIDKL